MVLVPTDDENPGSDIVNNAEKSGEFVSAPLLSGRESAPRVRNIVFGLSDLKFRAAVTPQMITSIYVLFIAAVVLFCVSLAVERSEPGVKNILGLVLVIPAILVGAIVTARVVLEFVLTVFIVRTRVEEMRTSIESVPGLVDQMNAVADTIATVAEKMSQVAENMTDMADKMGELNDRMSSITETIEKLDQQLPTIVENTTDIPGKIGGLPLDQLKRGWQTLRGVGQSSDADEHDDR